MKNRFLRYVYSLILLMVSPNLNGQNEIVFDDGVVTVNEIATAKINIIKPSFETFNKYVVELSLIKKIELIELRQIEKVARKHYTEKFQTKKVIIEVTNWGEELKLMNETKDQARIQAFYDYIYYRLETTELSEIEGVYESIADGGTFEYRVVILKSINDPGAYEAYLLGSTDPDLPVTSTILKLRPTAVPDKYLTQFWLKNGYTTSNQLTVFNNGILNAGTKSYIKMYPSPNETRKYKEINPLVEWDKCGSGVLLGPNGIIATNQHVISGAKSIKVKLTIGGKIMELNASLLAQEIETDIALIQINDTNEIFSNISPISVQDSLNIGEEIMTLGYPNPIILGENVKLNKGYITALVGQNSRKDYFQTDLPIWYGNSGGPCFDSNGNLLGLVSEIRFDRGQKLENVCFVTSSSNLVRLINTTKYIDNISRIRSVDEADISDLMSRSIFIMIKL